MTFIAIFFGLVLAIAFALSGIMAFTAYIGRLLRRHVA
jgi:hypothetical protein